MREVDRADINFEHHNVVPAAVHDRAGGRIASSEDFEEGTSFGFGRRWIDCMDLTQLYGVLCFASCNGITGISKDWRHQGTDFISLLAAIAFGEGKESVLFMTVASSLAEFLARANLRW